MNDGITNPALSENLKGLSGEQFLTKLLSNLIAYCLIAAAILFAFMILTGGIRWITSTGDKGKLELAQAQITHAIIGLGVVFLLYAMINIINVVFGVDLLKLTLPKLE
jgi:hypothetical protein